MQLFFGGTEQRGWRTLLQREGVEHVSLSYIGLRRRRKDPMTFSIAQEYPGQRVYLDSGAYTLNKADSTVTLEEAEEIHADYLDFVMANLPAIEFASEFDASILGVNHIAGTRMEFWHGPELEGKWMPVWHSEYGTRELEDMAGTYDRVGVLQGDTSADLTPLLRKLSGRTRLHGVAMTQMDAMAEIPWASVGSTSWLSPTQYGDTFVWTGRELKRYPKKYKERSRKQHRTWLQDQGFDVEKIEADDNAELLRLSVWSWQNFAASLDQGRAVTISALDPFRQNPEQDPEEVDTPVPQVRNAELIPRPERKLLPVLGMNFQTRTDADGNEIREPHLTTPGSGLLQCSNCFVREKCPEARPGEECAYDIPAQVRTGSQLSALQDWLIETQTQRVAYMRLVEQLEGGYSDANLTTEMLHLQRMIRAKQESQKDGFSIKIEASGNPARAGMIANIFGSDVTGRMGALPAAADSSDIIEATIVEESN